MATSDYISWTGWITKVLFEQDYIVDNIFYQENESAIKMEKYRLKSCGVSKEISTLDIFSLRIFYIGNIYIYIYVC